MIAFIETLQNYRERIKGIDYSIMALIAQRVNLAKEIGNLKSGNSLPIRNYQVEKQVYDRISGFASEFSLDGDFSIEIFEKIIQQSVQAQIDNISFKSGNGNTKNCLVIGGNGQMGRWFVNFLKSSGNSVDIQDPTIDENEFQFKELPTNMNKYDIIAICSPLRKMKEVIKNVISRKPRGLIFEIASIKNEIVDLVYQANEVGLNIISVHPMYGPLVNNLIDRNFVVCTTDNLDKTSKSSFLDLFKDTMVNIVEVELKDHDKYMQYSLGLSHLINLLNGSVLTNCPIDFPTMMSFAGTTFKNQVLNTIDIFDKNPDLFHSIQNLNPYRNELHGLMKKSLDDLLEASKEDAGQKFAEIIRQGRNFFEQIKV